MSAPARTEKTLSRIYSVCQHPGCKKKPDTWNKKYCSREHARHSGLSNGLDKKVTGSGQTGSSSSKKGGTHSIQSFYERKNDVNSKEENIEKILKRPTGGVSPVRKGASSSTENALEPGTAETKNALQHSSTKTTGFESPLEDFIVPRLVSKEERSRPTNLLDDSIYHLHELMKSAPRQEPGDLAVKCNLAKNLTQMMKLKLDIYKEGRNEKS